MAVKKSNLNRQKQILFYILIQDSHSLQSKEFELFSMKKCAYEKYLRESYRILFLKLAASPCLVVVSVSYTLHLRQLTVASKS